MDIITQRWTNFILASNMMYYTSLKAGDSCEKYFNQNQTLFSNM